MTTAKEAEKAPTAAQPDGWPDQRVPNAAVTEIEILELENIQFTNIFVRLEVPSVPPDPTIPAPGWNGVEKVDDPPRQQNKEATEKKNGWSRGTVGANSARRMQTAMPPQN